MGKEFFEPKDNVCLIHPNGKLIENFAANILEDIIVVPGQERTIPIGSKLLHIRQDLTVQEYYIKAAKFYEPFKNFIPAHYRIHFELPAPPRMSPLPSQELFEDIGTDTITAHTMNVAHSIEINHYYAQQYGGYEKRPMPPVKSIFYDSAAFASLTSPVMPAFISLLPI